MRQLICKNVNQRAWKEFSSRHGSQELNVFKDVETCLILATCLCSCPCYRSCARVKYVLFQQPDDCLISQPDTALHLASMNPNNHLVFTPASAATDLLAVYTTLLLVSSLLTQTSWVWLWGAEILDDQLGRGVTFVLLQKEVCGRHQ